MAIEGVLDFHTQMQSQVSDVSDLQKTEYGMLDYSFTDPWGHFITFGESTGEWEG